MSTQNNSAKWTALLVGLAMAGGAAALAVSGPLSLTGARPGELARLAGTDSAQLDTRPLKPAIEHRPTETLGMSYALFDREQDGRFDMIELDRDAGLVRVRFDIPGFGPGLPVILPVQNAIGVAAGDLTRDGLTDVYVADQNARTIRHLLLPKYEAVISLDEAYLGFEPAMLFAQLDWSDHPEVWAVSGDWRHVAVYRATDGLSAPLLTLDVPAGEDLALAWMNFRLELAVARSGDVNPGGGGVDGISACFGNVCGPTPLPPKMTGDLFQDGLVWASYERDHCAYLACSNPANACMLTTVQTEADCRESFNRSLDRLIEQYPLPNCPTMGGGES
jgi:hypothetical protein